MIFNETIYIFGNFNPKMDYPWLRVKMDYPKMEKPANFSTQICFYNLNIYQDSPEDSDWSITM